MTFSRVQEYKLTVYANNFYSGGRRDCIVRSDSTDISHSTDNSDSTDSTDSSSTNVCQNNRESK